jgi:hypothetical protein
MFAISRLSGAAAASIGINNPAVLIHFMVEILAWALRFVKTIKSAFRQAHFVTKKDRARGESEISHLPVPSFALTTIPVMRYTFHTVSYTLLIGGYNDHTQHSVSALHYTNRFIRKPGIFRIGSAGR